MNKQLSQTLATWLLHYDMKVSRSYLSDKIRSHPEYPSLACVTDVLDELGIANVSMVVNRDLLHELPLPFLAHAGSRTGGFVIIEDVVMQIKRKPEFEKDWDGIVVLIEKPVNWIHQENTKALEKDTRKDRQIKWSVAAIILSSVLCLLFSSSMQTVALLLVSLTGLGIAILIPCRL
jgi:hypothetical protein